MPAYSSLQFPTVPYRMNIVSISQIIPNLRTQDDVLERLRTDWSNSKFIPSAVLMYEPGCSGKSCITKIANTLQNKSEDVSFAGCYDVRTEESNLIQDYRRRVGEDWSKPFFMTVLALKDTKALEALSNSLLVALPPFEEIDLEKFSVA